MWWYLYNYSWSWFWFLNTTDWEVPVIILQVVVLSEFIDTSDFKDSSISSQCFFGLDLITGQVPITNKLLSWLVYVESFWQSLPTKVY